jgi:hypothetical protein
MNAIYRFRSADKLLDDNFSEFTRIYLANRELLNDPMEGFFNITFCGNKTLWANLFKHYYQSIWLMWLTVAVKHARHKLSAQDVVIGDNNTWNDDFIYNEISLNFESSWLKFCNTYKLNVVFEHLEKCNCPVNTAMLELILQTTVPYAAYYGGFFDEANVLREQPDLQKLLLDIIARISLDSHANDDKQDFCTGIAKTINVMHRVDLGIHQKYSPNYIFIMMNFVSVFIDRLCYFCTPFVCSASFSKEFDHLLTWAHYADGHKGVCLIFDKNANYAITRTKEKARFHPVHYDYKTTDHPFFSNLFRLTRTHLLNRWDPHNTPYFDRDTFWDRALYPYFHKHCAWKHEEEERLLVDDFMNDDFSQEIGINESHLKGVIFGFRMPANQKIAIKNKAEELGYDSLKFYHAVVSEHNKGIRVFDEEGKEYMDTLAEA